MVDVIVDQFALGVGDGVLNGMKLLREVEAWLTRLDHADKRAQVSFRAFQTLDDGRMTLVFHLLVLSPGIGYTQPHDALVDRNSALAIRRHVEGMKAETDVSVLPAFLGSAFVFGMVHALMPGHGKSVLVSYHLGRPGRNIDGVMTGTLLALTHVGLAVVLVLAGIAVISRSIATGGRAPPFEARWSAALITA